MASGSRDGRPSRRLRRSRTGGATLVEFSLILPIFILLLMAVIEFALLFNAYLAINFASRDASLVAAEAGDEGDADCKILEAVERTVNAPADKALISQVRIYRSDSRGQPITGAISVFSRSASMQCTKVGGGTVTVPYTRGAQDYQPSVRCNRLAGCSGRTVIDQIGVEITYVYRAKTPFGVFTTNGLSTLIKGNVMRMEPVL